MCVPSTTNKSSIISIHSPIKLLFDLITRKINLELPIKAFDWMVKYYVRQNIKESITNWAMLS